MRRPIGILSLGSLPSLGLGVLFVASWSSGFIGAKLGTADAPVLTVLMWRFVPLALALTPLLRTAHGELTRSDATRHICIGALSQTGYLLTVYWAIDLGVSTGTTALIDGIQPLVIAAGLGPILGVAVSGRQWFGLAIGLSGVLVVTWADATAPGTSAPLWSYAVPLLGMLSLVAATLIERRGASILSPLRGLAIHCTASAVIFTALALATGTAAPPMTGSFWLATAWLVVIPTFGGYGLYWHLLRRIGVAQVNALLFLVPPVTALWGAALFAEPFTLATAAGLVLAGLACACVAGAGAQPSTPRAPRG